MDNKNTHDTTLYGGVAPRNFDEGLLPSGETMTPEVLSQLEAEIFTARGDIQEFLSQNGEKSFYDYSKSHVRENRNPLIKNRKGELHDVVYKEVVRLLGTKIAKSVVKQLKGNDSVSTIQHSVPLGHPYILNATIFSALPYFGATHPNLQNVIVMANSLASFNNYTFPKADALHFWDNEKMDIQQFHFFGQTSEAFPTIYHEPYGEAAIEEIEKRIMKLRQNGSITKQEMQNLINLLEEIYSSPHVLSQDNYLDQLTILNYYLFKRLMEGYKKQIPNLIFLSQELTTLALIEKYHLNTETLLGKMIFDEKYQTAFVEIFDGLNGAFNTTKETGTFLFWARRKGREHRERLRLKGDELVSLDSDYKLSLTPEAIREAIKREELIPSTAFVFIVLAFYYGLILGGGLAQVNNLTELKNAYKKYLEKVGEESEVQALEGLLTTNMIISRPTILYMQSKDLRIPTTGMDIDIYGNGKVEWEKVIEATKQVSVKDIVTRLYPFYYNQFVKEKKEELSNLTEKDMESVVEFSSKIPALFEVKEEA